MAQDDLAFADSSHCSLCFASGKIESLHTISLFSRVHGSERLQASHKSRTRDLGSTLLSAAPSPNVSLVDSLHQGNMSAGATTEPAEEGAEEDGETVCRSDKASDHSNEFSTGSSFTRRRFVGRTGEGESSRSRHCNFGRESRSFCVEDVGGRPPQRKGRNKCAAGWRSVGFVCPVRGACAPSAARLESLRAEAAVLGAHRFKPNPSQDVCHLQEVRGLQAEVATLRAATVLEGEVESVPKRR